MTFLPNASRGRGIDLPRTGRERPQLEHAMQRDHVDRRRFLERITGSAVFAALPALNWKRRRVRYERSGSPQTAASNATPRIRFAVIGINHSHINSQVDAVLRGGGALVSVYAKEADLLSG